MLRDSCLGYSKRFGNSPKISAMCHTQNGNTSPLAAFVYMTPHSYTFTVYFRLISNKYILELCMIFIMIYYETHRQVLLKRSIWTFNKSSQDLKVLFLHPSGALFVCGMPDFSIFFLFAFFWKLCDMRESNVNQVNPIPSRPSEARQSGPRILGAS